MEPVDQPAGAVGAIEGLRTEAGVSVVRLVGEMDISNADALGAELDRMMGNGNGSGPGTGANRLVVDLAGLEFMDSSGIAMLLRAAARVGAISVRNPTAVVRR